MSASLPLLHPIVVHFAVALLVLAGLFSFLSLFAKREFWKDLSLKALVVGCIFSPIAVVTGLIEEQKMQHDGVDKMLMLHKFNGLAVLFFFLLLLTWYWLRKQIPQKKEYFAWVASMIIGTCMVLLQGYLGGELVFTKGMGLKPVEEAMGSQSGHDGGGNQQAGGHDMKDKEDPGKDKGKDDMKDMKGMDSKKGKDDMKEMSNSDVKDTYIINGNFYQYNMKDKDNVNDMKNMDNSKGKDDIKEMKGMDSKNGKDDMKDMKNMDNKKGKDEMKGMNMNNPLDTFKFKDNNPAYTKSKKKKNK